MAHVRRKFADIHRAQGSAIADKAIRRIAQLYAVGKEARGMPSGHRVEIRQEKAKPVFGDLEVWKSGYTPNCPVSPASRRWREQSAMLCPAWHGCDHTSIMASWN